MVGKNRSYVLTDTAARDFRKARSWSLLRWGKSLTKEYFKDLHKNAEYIVENGVALSNQKCFREDIGLGIYPVREHYIIYFPVNDKKIIIVALIRQSRDVPSILLANSFIIRREVQEPTTTIKF